MTTIHKIAKEKFIYDDEELTLKYLFDSGKIWLTKKDIAKVFKIDKKLVWVYIDNIISNSYYKNANTQLVYNKNTMKYKRYYSLDIIILIWYTIKSYDETRFLIKTNKMIKNEFYSNKIKFNFLYFSSILRSYYYLFKNSIKPYFV